jgi:hypothetical protein
LSVFAGLRPLAAQKKKEARKRLSRRKCCFDTGLITLLVENGQLIENCSGYYYKAISERRLPKKECKTGTYFDSRKPTNSLLIVKTTYIFTGTMYLKY